ncbi:kinase-like domain-containing protein [Mycena alexandri]|uniref:Kinase-like domain-containing protein n=1 Tax=Mycena alexandri TaxID=1745969 RepID=A0AAD6SHR0_9AGAR|nr:kinase-like domain-containing protein [Mycena alexandri]KAJ7040198.1 kinase-like domain-containing protein [Mycena alexandri]
MSLEAAIQNVLAEVPVPGLSSAFRLFSFIVSSVQATRESKKQLHVLANGVGQLLSTLNAEFRESRIVVANCAKSLSDLEKLLQDIHRFVQKEREKPFLKSLLNKDSRINQIESFYRHIELTVGAFQISSLLSVQTMLRNNETARTEDAGMLHAKLRGLEQNQDELRNVLEINHNNMLAMMASLQRRLNVAPSNDQEQNFYSHTLDYLTSMSGRQVQLEDWMIASFDVEYGPEIGVGGFGKVYRATWNRMEVAIKVLQNVAGVTPSVALLQKEINIWLNLRHPHILQFLGANTLDDSPFVVMPYIPYNARQFLEQWPIFDPVYILRDVALALHYLHSRKICHGDLKGVNILVEDSGRALLCDFGLSRIKADATSRTAHTAQSIIAGSRNWMAPELLAGSPPKLPSDIYAFGMTLFELYTDETPLVNIAHTDFIELVFRSGVRPDRPDSDEVPKLTDSLWTLAEKCWLQAAKARPTAGQIHELLVDIISDISLVQDHPTEVTTNNPRGTELRDPNHNRGSLSGQAVSILERFKPQFLSDYVRRTGPESRQALTAQNVAAHHSREVTTNIPRGTETQHPNHNLPGDNTSAGSDTDLLEKLSAMSKLVVEHQTAKRFKEAEELDLELVRLGLELVRKRKQVLGADHPDTLQSMHNLGYTYIKRQQWKEAEQLYSEVVWKQKQVLGVDHPDTLRSMQNLALTYAHRGDLYEAEELHLEVIKKQKQVLGLNHSDTLQSMHNLANTYKWLTKWKEAKELYLEIIKKQTQVLGLNHSDTLQSMHNLADTYKFFAEWKEAEELWLEVVRKRKQVLGADHPDTLWSMHNLAATYMKLEKWKEAEKLYSEVVQKQTQVLGADHPDTLLSRNRLVDLYRWIGKPGYAVMDT